MRAEHYGRDRIRWLLLSIGGARRKRGASAAVLLISGSGKEEEKGLEAAFFFSCGLTEIEIKETKAQLNEAAILTWLRNVK